VSDIRDTLGTEVAEAETRRAEPPGRMHSTRAASGANHVYTVRMPADRLAELRGVAEHSGDVRRRCLAAGPRRWLHVRRHRRGSCVATAAAATT